MFSERCSIHRVFVLVSIYALITTRRRRCFRWCAPCLLQCFDSLHSHACTV
uniref:Uncharacterized protein n=1 Tax=Oryza brachyantha TaxID=4533 RepID=J3MB80_ORYBR